jgi:cytidylate kinase
MSEPPRQTGALDHVLWIGGPPGVGKTTAAARIARRRGFRLYCTDTRTWAHRDRAIAEGCAAAIRWEAMTPAERLALPLEEGLALALHRERGPMVADDLRALPRAQLVVAEGTPLPAAVVANYPGRAAWLVAPEPLRRERLTGRGTTGSTLERYLALGDIIGREVSDHGLPVIEITAAMTREDVATAVESLLAGAIAAGPRAGSVTERQALLRDANDAILQGSREFLARPWARADPQAFVREFACECQDDDCAAIVPLSLPAYERARDEGPVLAHPPVERGATRPG